MQDAAHHEMMADSRELLGRLADPCDPGLPTSFVHAMQSFLTAMDYDDATLIRSSLEGAFVELAKAVNEVIQKRLGWPEQCREALRGVWDHIKGRPLESWDELGSQIEARLNEMLRVLTELRDGPVRLLQSHEYELESAAQLQSDIGELEHLKKSILEAWPWSNRLLPPVDEKMLNASMTLLKSGGKGERIEDFIARLGGKTDKL